MSKVTQLKKWQRWYSNPGTLTPGNKHAQQLSSYKRVKHWGPCSKPHGPCKQQGHCRHILCPCVNYINDAHTHPLAKFQNGALPFGGMQHTTMQMDWLVECGLDLTLSVTAISQATLCRTPA